MQKKKNQSLQDVKVPSSSGSDSSTSLSTGVISPGGHVVHTGRGSSLVVDSEGPGVGSGNRGKSQTDDTVQSTVNTPADGPRNVTTFVVGHENPNLNSVGVGQSTVRVMRGVLKDISLDGGHWYVCGCTMAGNVKVVTVAAEAVTIVDHGVWKAWPTPPLGIGLGLPHGPSYSQSSGGPRLTSGQGGRNT